MLQYADLHTSYFSHLSSCTFMQNLPICQQCASGIAATRFLNQFSMASHKDKKTDPWVGVPAREYGLISPGSSSVLPNE